MSIISYQTSKLFWTTKEWLAWDKRVCELEAEGLTRSDAQGVKKGRDRK